jgi:hypothetical protein
MTMVVSPPAPHAATGVHTPAQHPSPTTQAATADLDCTAVKAKQCIKRIRRRLERWELPHLRDLAASLHAELEEMTARAERAERDADMWHDQMIVLVNSFPEGTSIGMSIDGSLHVLQGGAA